MNTKSVMLKPWLAPGLAAFLILGGSPAVRATEVHTGAWGLISTMGGGQILSMTPFGW